MGETDDKEIVPADTPTNDVEEPKETEKLLRQDIKKEEPEHQNGVKSDDEDKDKEKNGEDDVKKTNGEEVIEIPENPPKEEGREVKPKKIPIGGIKMPGFFTRKPKPSGDGAEGELLENAGNEEKAKEETKDAENVAKPGFLQNLQSKLSNPFAKKAPVAKPENTEEIKDGGNYF